MSSPLFSVVVITYNSSKYVLETLESIKSQTYQNLEVIISDDCSTDETINICKCWIEENKGRFVKIELITVDKNTGITANCNRALPLTNSEWIKFIAGDDILFPRAIESHVEFISQKKHENAVIVVSSIQVFKDTIESKSYVWPNFHFSHNQREQLRRQLIGGFIKAPGVFINREILVNKFGGFNERYPMYEDDPLWILFLTNGYQFHFNNEILVGYRIHNNSVSNSVRNRDVGKHLSFWDNFYSFKSDVSFPLMLKNKFYLEYWLCRARYYIAKNGLNSCFWHFAERMISYFLKILALWNRLIYKNNK